MYSAEVLSQLRSMNHLSQEMRRVPPDSAEAILLQKQIAALRARLPNSILDYHDRFEARGKTSVTQVTGSSCGACHLKLPSGLMGELAVPGRFGVCPNCGVFLWTETKVRTTEVAPVAKAKAKAGAKN